MQKTAKEKLLALLVALTITLGLISGTMVTARAETEEDPSLGESSPLIAPGSTTYYLRATTFSSFLIDGEERRSDWREITSGAGFHNFEMTINPKSNAATQTVKIECSTNVNSDASWSRVQLVEYDPDEGFQVIETISQTGRADNSTELTFTSEKTEFILLAQSYPRNAGVYVNTVYYLNMDFSQIDPGADPDPDPDPEPEAELKITSAGVRGGILLNEYGMHGTQFENANGMQVPSRSMPINILNVPEGTQSFAVFVDDITYPWVHWMAVDIGADNTSIPANASKSGAVGMVQGINDFGTIGYGGPTPPDGDHQYDITVLALDIDSAGLSEGFSESEYWDAVEGHILDEATITATYRRQLTADPDPDPEGGYTLTLQAGTGGRITQGNSGGYQAGSVVYITASPNSGYRFNRWTASPGVGFDNAGSAGTWFVMPASDVTVTASFTNTGSSGGSSGGSGGSSGGGSYTGTSNSNQQRGSGTAAVSTGGAVATGTSVDAAALRSNVEAAVREAAGNTATVTIRNVSTISVAALRGAAEAASGKTVILYADTMTADGKAVQGRLYVEPAKLTSRTTDLKPGVYTEEAYVSRVLSFFRSWFSNQVAVVKLEQEGLLGARLQVAAKVDLSGMNIGNLVFYSYDINTNTYTGIAESDCYMDAGGYLHFYTSQGGYIIISDGALTTG